MQSQLATNLEQRQQGEQFSILDPPSLPAKPASPNHLKVSLGGLLVGIALGIGFAALVEMTQQRVWKSADLDGLVPTRVLVAIPHLNTPNENRFRAAGRFVKFAVTTAMILLIVAGNLYALYRG
jgi:capsular polysaccharide biosynthesis protein